MNNEKDKEIPELEKHIFTGLGPGTYMGINCDKIEKPKVTFPRFPNPNNFKTKEEYTSACFKWKKDIISSFPKNFVFPVPYSLFVHSILPPAPKTEKKISIFTIKRKFSPKEAPLSSINTLELESALIDEDFIDPTRELSERCDRNAVITFGDRMKEEKAWGSGFFTPKPFPWMFKRIEDYTEALTNWMNINSEGDLPVKAEVFPLKMISKRRASTFFFTEPEYEKVDIDSPFNDLPKYTPDVELFNKLCEDYNSGEVSTGCAYFEGQDAVKIDKFIRFGPDEPISQKSRIRVADMTKGTKRDSEPTTLEGIFLNCWSMPSFREYLNTTEILPKLLPPEELGPFILKNRVLCSKDQVHKILLMLSVLFRSERSTEYVECIFNDKEALLTLGQFFILVGITDVDPNLLTPEPFNDPLLERLQICGAMHAIHEYLLEDALYIEALNRVCEKMTKYFLETTKILRNGIDFKDIEDLCLYKIVSLALTIPYRPFIQLIMLPFPINKICSLYHLLPLRNIIHIMKMMDTKHVIYSLGPSIIQFDHQLLMGCETIIPFIVKLITQINQGSLSLSYILTALVKFTPNSSRILLPLLPPITSLFSSNMIINRNTYKITANAIVNIIGMNFKESKSITRAKHMTFDKDTLAQKIKEMQPTSPLAKGSLDTRLFQSCDKDSNDSTDMITIIENEEPIIEEPIMLIEELEFIEQRQDHEVSVVKASVAEYVRKSIISGVKPLLNSETYPTVLLFEAIVAIVPYVTIPLPERVISAAIKMMKQGEFNNMLISVAFACDLVRYKALPVEIKKQFTNLINPKRGKRAMMMCLAGLQCGMYGIALIDQCIEKREWEGFGTPDCRIYYKKAKAILNDLPHKKVVKNVIHFLYCPKLE